MKPIAMWGTLVAVASTLLIARPCSAAEGCDGIDWPATQERALFASTPDTVAAGKSESGAPALHPQALYSITLSPQGQVTFRVPPGGRKPAEGAYAGLAVVHIARPGTYRVSTDQPVRIDLEMGTQTIASTNYMEQPGCSAPHKMVQFTLPAGDLLLELSNAGNAVVRLTVTSATPVPSSKG
jgi:hypothetical protein